MLHCRSGHLEEASLTRTQLAQETDDTNADTLLRHFETLILLSKNELAILRLTVDNTLMVKELNRPSIGDPSLGQDIEEWKAKIERACHSVRQILEDRDRRIEEVPQASLEPKQPEPAPSERPVEKREVQRRSVEPQRKRQVRLHRFTSPFVLYAFDADPDEDDADWSSEEEADAPVQIRKPEPESQPPKKRIRLARFTPSSDEDEANRPSAEAIHAPIEVTKSEVVGQPQKKRIRLARFTPSSDEDDSNRSSAGNKDAQTEITKAERVEQPPKKRIQIARFTLSSDEDEGDPEHDDNGDESAGLSDVREEEPVERKKIALARFSIDEDDDVDVDDDGDAAERPGNAREEEAVVRKKIALAHFSSEDGDDDDDDDDDNDDDVDVAEGPDDARQVDIVAPKDIKQASSRAAESILAVDRPDDDEAATPSCSQETTDSQIASRLLSAADLPSSSFDVDQIDFGPPARTSPVPSLAVERTPRPLGPTTSNVHRTAQDDDDCVKTPTKQRSQGDENVDVANKSRATALSSPTGSFHDVSDGASSEAEDGDEVDEFIIQTQADVRS